MSITLPEQFGEAHHTNQDSYNSLQSSLFRSLLITSKLLYSKVSTFFLTFIYQRFSNIPYLKGHPLLGRLRHVFQENGVLKNFIQAGHLAAKHPSGMCYYRIGNQPILLITKPEDVHALQVHHDEGISRNLPFSVFEKFFGPNSATDTGEDWRNLWASHRDIYSSYVLKSSALSALEDSMQAIIKQHLGKLNLDKSTPIDLRKFFLEIEMHITSKNLLACEYSPDLISNLINYTSKLTHHFFSFRSLLKWSLPSILRKIFFLKEETDLSKLRNNMKKELNQIMFCPNKHTIQNTDNCLKSISRLYSDKSENSPLEFDDYFTEASMILIATTESVTSSFLFTIKLLSAHPDIEEKLRNELKTGLRDKGFTMENIDKIDYLEMVIKESLRLYPTAPFFPRGVVKPFKLGEVNLARGDMVVYSPLITHRLSKLWDNPEKFIPERFSKENNTKIAKHSYIPFGLGPHLCIGHRFTYQVLKLLLSTIYTKYQVSLQDNDFEVTLNNGAMKPKNPVIAYVNKIEDQL